MERSQIHAQLWRPWPVAWEVSQGLIPYPDAVLRMDAEVAAIAKGDAPERVWLLEHPPLYTAGTSAMQSDLVDPNRFPVYPSGRGGQFTYHGPGQRVAYVMLDLKRRGSDVRAFVAALEDWIIGALAEFGLRGERREDRVGVWVKHETQGGEDESKIAAIGIRVRHWVSLHGISLNVAPELSHFSGIIPCGVRDHGVTSLQALGLATTLEDADRALAKGFAQAFGPITRS